LARFFRFLHLDFRRFRLHLKDLNYMRKHRKTFWIVPACICLLLAVLLLISNTVLVGETYTIRSSRLPQGFDGFRIVQLSDLHSRAFGKNSRTLLRKIESQKPDIVVLTGDMVNSTDTEFGTFETLARELAERWPVYLIVGNHEQMLPEETLRSLLARIESYGVTVLDNEKITLTRGDDAIDLYGLWYNLRYYSDQTNPIIQEDAETYFLSAEKIEELIGAPAPGRFRLLLSHNPVFFKSYQAWGADLTLAGHLHGGMVRLPFAGGVYSPERTFFPEYDAGLFTEGDCHMVVSRGLGNGKLGFRFANCPDVVTVVLQADN
jgi:predicted MPP superfamily phosphohydrolase